MILTEQTLIAIAFAYMSYKLSKLPFFNPRIKNYNFDHPKLRESIRKARE